MAKQPVTKQLFFKFACVVVASLVTFAGVMMSMDLLRQMPDREVDPQLRSSTRPHSIYQMKQYYHGTCSHCKSYRYFGSNIACCKKMHNRKWGHSMFQFQNGNYESNVRMTPAAQRNKPYLRRAPGIDYSQRSNSTNYVYLFPDPIAAPNQAPEPAVVLPPMFWDDYQNPQFAPWEDHPPDISAYPPIAYDYYDAQAPSIA